MKAIVNTAPDTLMMLDYPLPKAGAGQVRIRTGACGICATDLEMIVGWQRTGYPTTPGHEWAGTVDEVGEGIDPVLLNQRCVAENVWADGGEVGFEHPGGYGQFFLTEAANVYVLPHDFPYATAAMIEPLAVCVRAMHRLGTVPSDALVFGDGPIGLLMTALLSRAGVQDLVLIGGREARLHVAQSFGAQQTINYHDIDGDMATAIRRAAHSSFTAVIEATGSPRALTAGLDLAAREGKCLMIGDYGLSHADFLWNTILLKEITLLGTNASAGAWPEAVRLAVNGEAPLGKLVTHHIPAAEFATGIAKTRSRDGDVIKVILDWG